jgi:AmmeMemoRadiSam system protein A
MQKCSQPTAEFTEEQGQLLIRLARKIIARKLCLAFDDAESAAIATALADPIFDKQRGIFVTLHKNGQLRGCIGCLTGIESVRAGVARHAECAAFHDPRFRPLRQEEFEALDIEISILTEPEPLPHDSGWDLAKKLRPHVDGVIIKKGFAGSTFLPQVWEQLPRVEDFLGCLCAKAGLPSDAWRSGDLEVRTYQAQYFKEKRGFPPKP